MPKLGISYKIMVAPAIIAVMLVVFGLYSARNIWLVDSLVGELNAAVKTEQTAQEVESAVHGLQAAAFRSLALINMNKDDLAQTLMVAQFEAADELERMLKVGQAPAYLPRLQDYIGKVRQAYDAATSDTNLGAMMLQSASQAYDGLVQEASCTGSAASFRPGKPVCQPCLSGQTQGVRNDVFNEQERKLLG